MFVSYIIYLWCMVTSQSMNQEQPIHSPASPPFLYSTPRRPHLSLRPLYTIFTLLFGMLLGVGGLFAYQEYLAPHPISSYDECTKSRESIIRESYPATCITDKGISFTQPIPSREYACPKTEWIDCMPGPNKGIKPECTDEYLAWAKINCPDFLGAAL